MLVTSLLVQGDGCALGNRLNTLVSKLAINALVLLSLGADHPTLLEKVRSANIKCPVYLAETYGIIGYDEDAGRNVELMEKGRGSEYGYCGGSGGQGCVVVAYSGSDDDVVDDGATITGHAPSFPADASSLMVITDTSGTFKDVSSSAPLHYGGVAKETFVLSKDQKSLERVPYFWVASPAGKKKEPVGISTFKGEAGEAAKELLSKMPLGWHPSGDVGLFPCFTRGVNQYGKENVEVDAISGVMSEGKSSSSSLRFYGMFAHGELGPSSFKGFQNEVGGNIECAQHGGTTILSIHTAADAAKDDEL